MIWSELDNMDWASKIKSSRSFIYLIACQKQIAFFIISLDNMVWASNIL